MLIDIKRPGVQLLDAQEYNWKFIGKLVGTEWQDKWRREDGATVKSLSEILSTVGPVTVVLEEYSGEEAWWKKDANFKPKKISTSE